MKRAYPKIDITKLKPNPNNPRYITDEKKEKLKKSFKNLTALQKLRPIIVDDKYMVLGGNQRLDAGLALAQKEVYYDMFTREMANEMNSEAKADGRKTRTYKYYCTQIVITDNSGYGEYDMSMIRAEWLEFPLDDWGLDMLEYEDENDEEIEVEDDLFEMPNEEDIITNIKLGDVIKIGKHILVCGDSRDKKYYKSFENKDIVLLVTDPPYGVNYGNKNKILNSFDGANRIEEDIEGDNLTVEETVDIWEQAFSNTETILSNKSSFYIFIPSSYGLYNKLSKVVEISGLNPMHTIIWNKNNHVLGMADYNYKHEVMLYGWKKSGTHKFHGQGEQKSTVWNYDKPMRNDIHQTMKPVKLIANAIMNSSSSGEIIIDIFMGSGTAIVAAEKTNRICYGIEIKPKNCQSIIERMIILNPEIEIKINNIKYDGR